MSAAIVAESLVKRYGDVVALDGLSVAAEEGTVLALLGPNGAGKTTAVRILTTLLRADSGRAEVAGFDVSRQPGQLRAHIGLAGQAAAVDEHLTGKENLEMVGRLYHLPRRVAATRADELLSRFDLVEAGGRAARTYSGGMRRRLDLAASLVAAPPVLFLDEPTTGLDPRSRLSMWAVIEELVAEGTTLLLTTQYLEEADRLATAIAVVDGGQVIAEGTSEQLKSMMGGDRLEVTVLSDVTAGGAGARPAPPPAGPPAQGGAPRGGAPGISARPRVSEDVLGRAAAVLSSHGSGPAQSDPVTGRVSVGVAGGAAMLAGVVRGLDEAGVPIEDVSLHRPSLDDVFLTLTGRSTGAETAGARGGSRAPGSQSGGTQAPR